MLLCNIIDAAAADDDDDDAGVDAVHCSDGAVTVQCSSTRSLVRPVQR